MDDWRAAGVKIIHSAADVKRHLETSAVVQNWAVGCRAMQEFEERASRNILGDNAEERSFGTRAHLQQKESRKGNINNQKKNKSEPFCVFELYY